MTVFTISTSINKPLDVVVKALLNPENSPYWTADLEKFEVIYGKPGEVDSIGHLHYSKKGRSYIMEDRLIYCEPGKKYVSRISGEVIDATVETKLQSSGDQTDISIKWSGEGKIFFLKLLLPFLRKNLIKQSKSELETFKKLVETRGADFTDPLKE